MARRKKTSDQKKDDGKPDLTPMIDVVFLLIIFFMIVTEIVTDKVKMVLPNCETGAKPKQGQKIAIVNISRNGEVFLGAHRQEHNKVFQNNLKIKADEAGRDETGASHLDVSLRADLFSDWEVAQEVMAIMSDAEVKALRAHFSALAQKGGEYEVE